MQHAARALGVNVSTVQRRIAALEAGLGQRLIERRLGGYGLSALGAALQDSAAEAEAAVASFERRAAAWAAGPVGRLRLTCGSALAGRLAQSGLIAAFEALHRGISVELVVSDRRLDLAKGEADVALRRGLPGTGGLVGRRIADASWAVYASPAYLSRHGKPEGALALHGHRVVGCDGPIAEYPGGAWARSAVPPATVSARSDNWQGLLLAVRSGAGLAAIPRWQGDPDASLVRVIDDVGLTAPYYLLMHRDMRSAPHVRAFADFVASQISQFRKLFGSSNPSDR